jgi:uracil-DNA glycosylase
MPWKPGLVVGPEEKLLCNLWVQKKIAMMPPLSMYFVLGNLHWDTLLNTGKFLIKGAREQICSKCLL